MIRISPSLVLNWIVAALVAICAWFLLPGSAPDREIFRALAQWRVDSQVEISGKGSHASPWQSLSIGSKHGDGQAPTTIGLEDNIEGIFQDSPHSAIDMAVIFKNLHRLGSKQLACSVLLAWDKPDPIGLAAMEGAMLDFESVVLAAPVTRGAMMEAMPTDFRRASLAVDQLAGDISALPVVNRISIPTLIRGGENALAGFQAIDSEPTAEHLHLMARWDDRVIFAFPVLAALQHLSLTVEDLHIEVGQFLQLGNAGPKIPIDEFGRLALNLDIVAPKTAMLAKELIDAEAQNPNLPDLTHAILCDLRSHADITTRDFNRSLSTTTARLLQGQSKPEQLSFARINSSMELPILLALALAMSFASLLGRPLMSLLCVAALTGSALGMWLGVQNGMWLPGPAAAATICAAWLCSVVSSSHRKRTTSMPRLDRLKFESVDDPQ